MKRAAAAGVLTSELGVILGSSDKMITRLLSTRLRYGAVAQVFHWLTAFLVLAAYVTSPGGPEQRVYSAAIDFWRQLHELLGMAAFAIVLLRVVWQTIDRVSPEPALEPWMQRLATLMHVTLYALLLTVPLTAIVGAWLEGRPLTLLGLKPIEPLLQVLHQPGQVVSEIHGWLGHAMMWAAGLHAAAALFHHFVLGDDVLVSILPAPRSGIEQPRRLWSDWFLGSPLLDFTGKRSKSKKGEG